MNEVILVDKNDVAIGRMEKLEAHEKALLHRAFSVFIFNNKGEMLLQQRADKKYHSAGLWTNACCSHPSPGEDTAAAAIRRLKEELGFTTTLNKAFTFIYRTDFENGLTENEFDHVYTGIYDGPVIPDISEVKSYVYMPVDEVEKFVAKEPARYTSWFLIAFPQMIKWLSKSNGINLP
ncbi:MAG TPA: isopentenyl-diphosphate Delta-isomerase [Flavitalea sp.]|nr:isopentenyl-diphosphate Delta-isomerase [Flavitalea sp.]